MNKNQNKVAEALENFGLAIRARLEKQIDKQELTKLLINRIAQHKNTFNIEVDAGRIEELCWLILELLKNPKKQI